MIFTEYRYDRSMEKMMKGIPNFYPRGSGIVVTGNFRYTAEMCDCKYCGYYGVRKRMFGSKMRLLRGTNFRWCCICQRNHERYDERNQTQRFPPQTKEIYIIARLIQFFNIKQIIRILREST